jgi:hypothetical protein
MSTGYLNNNPTNINYYPGNNWEGATGITTKTGDGQNNIQFQDIVFGLRAAMQLVYNYLVNYKLNLYNLVKRWTGLTDPNSVYNYCSIINEYTRTDFDMSPGAAPIDPTNTNILAIVQGIVQNEIPEYNEISNSQYQQAMAYYQGKNYDYTASNDNRPATGSPGQQTAGLNTWIILAIVSAGAIFFFKKK